MRQRRDGHGAPACAPIGKHWNLEPARWRAGRSLPLIQMLRLRSQYDKAAARGGDGQPHRSRRPQRPGPAHTSRRPSARRAASGADGEVVPVLNGRPGSSESGARRSRAVVLAHALAARGRDPAAPARSQTSFCRAPDPNTISPSWAVRQRESAMALWRRVVGDVEVARSSRPARGSAWPDRVEARCDEGEVEPAVLELEAEVLLDGLADHPLVEGAWYATTGPCRRTRGSRARPRTGLALGLRRAPMPCRRMFSFALGGVPA